MATAVSNHIQHNYNKGCALHFLQENINLIEKYSKRVKLIIH